MLRVSVPEAVGGKTVVGQLTVDRAVGAGYVTAYGCDDGIPTDADGTVSQIRPQLRRQRLTRVVEPADRQGRRQRRRLLLHLRPTALIVDINAVSDVGISSFPNYRIDTRSQVLPPGSVTPNNVPVWPPYTTLPPLDGVAALTGLPADATITEPTDPGRQDRQLRRRPTAVGARAGRRDHRGERRRDHPVRRPVPHPICPMSSDRFGRHGSVTSICCRR